MKKIASNFFNILLVAFLVFQLFLLIPRVLNHIHTEGTKALDFSVLLMNNEVFHFNEQKKPLLLVFWATWCKPCQLELFRLNQLVKEGKIRPDSLLAISSGEDPALVTKTAIDRNYHFLTGFDPSGSLSQKYKVQATPTTLLIDQDHIIKWMSDGLSPSLEWRLTGGNL